MVGAGVGFGLGALGYTLIVPVLEASSGVVRELQGFAWNVVPGSSVLGAIIGLLLGRAWRRRVLRRAARPMSSV